MAVASAWLGHSDVNLTVKQYGRWAAEAREQWQWAKKMDEPIDAIAQRPALGVIDGGPKPRPQGTSHRNRKERGARGETGNVSNLRPPTIKGAVD